MSAYEHKITGSCDLLDEAIPAIQGLNPYVPGMPISELQRKYGVSDVLKLASNENPLGASPAALQAMARELDDLWLYPDGGGFALRKALADLHGVEPACITLGNGSNDVLVMLAQAFLGPGREAVFSQYCFAVYPIATQATGATARVVPALPADESDALGHDLDAMLEAIGPDTRVVFVANPNNPTGTWVEAQRLEGFVAAVPDDVLVVVDEAYFEYAQRLGAGDATRWIKRYPNLLVTRTFSKAYGLAGIRVGYAVSSPQVAGLLNRIRQPFNVNSLALAGAEAAITDTAFLECSVLENASGVVQLGEGLTKLGLVVTPSACNFLLADLGQDAAPVNEDLLRAGVIVRPVANYGLPDHLRITVGTAEQNERLLAALAMVLN